MAEVTLFVENAENAKDIQALENSLMQINGVERALVDIEDGETKISYDENRVTRIDLVRQIEDHGFITS